MDAEHWKTLPILTPGETLKFEGSKTNGFMEEADIKTYSVLGADGCKNGEIVINDHTAVRGFRRTIHFTQRDANGNILAQKAYTVDRFS
ncbi:MAG: hypothetical protein L6Q74_13555 [Sphaerotilus natans subsp. sulfidivorans]|uniref:hypothetical protein n=1 Tax=Sphaerotilus sulfidivorans TaxID=639200 RepID=UPI0023538A97|nr:hypothetical protein [Sphaerotilus sulfidivorans]MCK6402909.1 hypothetical protein [Sphaerotilus sulfidivorans]